MEDDNAPELETDDPREILLLTPEARRQMAEQEALNAASLQPFAGSVRRRQGWADTSQRIGLIPGARPFEVIKRIAVGTWNDGFIHAGNLAYMAILAIFPFFILSGFLFSLVGEAEDRQTMVETVLIATPPAVQEVIRPVALTVIDARNGWLLWAGAAVGLWTVSSLIESIRDILRRAYGTKARYGFWRYRLSSAGLIIAAVVVLLLSLFAQVLMVGMLESVDTRLPRLAMLIETIQVTRIIPAFGLLGSLYVLFYTLTPQEYRTRRYPKWPGALFTALWWIGVTAALPLVLRAFFAYDLTYGSLAGIMIALFFFWLVGLGLVIGAELNAALAEPEAHQNDDNNTGAGAL